MDKRVQTKRYILIAVLILFPFFAELVQSSWDVFIVHGDNYGIQSIEIDSNAITKKDEKNKHIYEFKNVNQYINKLEVKFRNGKSNSFSIALRGYNDFGKAENSVVNVQTLKQMDKTTQYINKKVKSLKIIVNDPTLKLKAVTVKNKVSFNVYHCSFYAAISIFIGFCLYIYWKKVYKLELVFAALIFLMGSLYILSSPKVSHWGPDSEIHYRLAHTNSFIGSTFNRTNSFNEAIELPSIAHPNTQEDNMAISEILNKEKNNVTINTENKSLFPSYNQLAYLPYSAGIFASRLLHVPFSISFMIGKAMGLLFYAILCYFAIKIAKKGKRIFFTLSLIPSMVFLSTQYSLDGIIFSSLLLSTSLFLSQYFDKTKKITFGWTLAFIGSVCFGSFAKAVYGLFILLPFLFKENKFLNRKQMRLFKGSMLIIFFMLMSIMVLPMIVNSSAPSDLRGGITSAPGQIMSLLTNPLSFLRMYSGILFNSLHSVLISPSTLGSYFYLGSLNETLTITLTVLIIFLAFVDWNIDTKIPRIHRILFVLFLSVLVLMIYGALYISFTPVGATEVKGIQPRYFLPLLPLLCFLPANSSIKILNNSSKITLYTIVIVSLVSFASFYTMILTTFCN